MKKLFKDRDAVAALEFALVLTPLCFLIFGAYDLVEAFAYQRRASYIATSVAQIVTHNAVNQITNTNAISTSQLVQAANVAYAMIPALQASSPPGKKNSDFGVAITMAKTASATGDPSCTIPGPAAQNCAYNPQETWSGLFAGSIITPRPCNLASGANQSYYNPNYVPSGALNLYPLAIVDVALIYHPLFMGWLASIGQPITIYRSVFVSQRVGAAKDWMRLTDGLPQAGTSSQSGSTVITCSANYTS